MLDTHITNRIKPYSPKNIPPKNTFFVSEIPWTTFAWYNKVKCIKTLNKNTLTVLTLRVVEDLGRVVLLAEWVDDTVVENR